MGLTKEASVLWVVEKESLGKMSQMEGSLVPWVLLPYVCHLYHRFDLW